MHPPGVGAIPFAGAMAYGADGDCAEWTDAEGAPMPVTVNLDAMIDREDFLVTDDTPSDPKTRGSELYLNQLTEEGRLATFKKPDFQRETSAWSPEIVVSFIKSALDGDVIPAIIMWKSPQSGNVFVIDGAHRLSALIAWILDDYGDREISGRFFKYQITEAQNVVADKTRKLVEGEVGNYKKLNAYRRQPDLAPDELALKRSRAIANDPLFIQWVTGDAKAAETSYMRINSTAVAINDAERELIDARRKPDGLAVRAIMRAGTGHEYWSQFDPVVRAEISSLANGIYNHLIKPIVEYPVVTLDLPAADRGYSANSVKTILDLVRYLNPIPAPSRKKRTKVFASVQEVMDGSDIDGSATIEYLNRVRKSTERVFGREHVGSLALHPAIYCYGSDGKFIPKAFIGAVGFVSELDTKGQFYKFTDYRAKFEEFLLKHRYFVNQIGRSQGSGGKRGISALVRLYAFVFDQISRDATDEKIIEALKLNDTLSFLYVPLLEEEEEAQESGKSRRFSQTAKATVILRETLAGEIRCPECKARLYRKSISKDHRVNWRSGGLSTSENLDLMHPYCNSGHKERRLALEIKKGLGNGA
jgi:Protein of unknown function DUF262